MKTEKRRLGDVGENVTCVFLEKHGFKIIERNYLRKWGEIDIVAKKGSIMHFVEVKSISHTTALVSGVTDGWRAEDNMHPQKLRRLHRAIQTYLLEKHLDLDWQLDLVIVKIDENRRTASVEMLSNIV
ncbi:MAG: YraN family protein [Patescibacteria group bacterium]